LRLVHGSPAHTLFWALAASIAVHAGIVAATLAGGARPGVAAITSRALVATLMTVQPPPPEPVVVRTPAPTVLATPVAMPAQPPAPPPAPALPAPAEPAPKGPAHGLGPLEVTGKPLADKNRMGYYMTRQLFKYPAEVDTPTKLDEKIVVRYPTAALVAGREDSVAVWVVVEPDGVASEVEVLDGSEEFANEVVAAVRAARFIPARKDLQPIRYPISLEFEFRTGAVEPPPVSAEAK